MGEAMLVSRNLEPPSSDDMGAILGAVTNAHNHLDGIQSVKFSGKHGSFPIDEFIGKSPIMMQDGCNIRTEGISRGVAGKDR